MAITKTSKVASAAVGFSLALALFVGVGASTAGAQAMSLSQLVDLFISLGIISPEKAAAAKAAVSSSATATATTYTRDLTIGSTGADVTALQNALGVTPATGYYGSITAAAVKAYQTSKGISATGYFGPLTRASMSGSSTVVTPGTTTTTTTVVNSGVEGTLTVNRSSVPNTTSYEGDMMRTVLAFKAEAKLSDINIQRVKLDLGNSTSIYTKVYKTLYLVDDAGRTLAKADLNSNTVVKNGSNYELTLGGFSYNVPKDSSKILTVKADLYSSIDSNDRTARTITVQANGVRGIDGAGIDQYAPGTGFSQQMSINTSLIESATLKLSTNSANFKVSETIAAAGSEENEFDKLALLAFDLRAEKDSVLVNDIRVVVNTSGSANATNVYLMDGSNVIDSETVLAGSSSASVLFDDLDLNIPVNTTKTLTVRADIREAVQSATTFSATVVAATIDAENTQGDEVDASGSATGETMTVRNIGAEIALASKGISKSQAQFLGATTTVEASFDVKLKAVGGDISFGPQSNASTTFNFVVYKDGVNVNSSITSSSTSFSVPSTGVVTHGSGSFTVQENNEITVPVKVTFVGNGLSLGSYAVGLDSVKWGTSVASSSLQTTGFMTGNLDWRTNTIQLP